MAGKGVDPAKIKTAGLGPENPIASNETAEGRRKNRRVELDLTF
jgi:outer membrane protein OmpA-like peptidoglycan-associated protein